MFEPCIQILGLELAQQQAEAANGVIKQYPVPVYCEVLEFGVYITEDFVAQAADLAVALVNNSKLSGSETILKTLTVGNSNTKLKLGSGTKADQTTIAADTDLDNGHVVVANLKGVNRIFVPGDILEFKQTTDASGAGGAYIPYAVVRWGGFDPRRADVWHEVD